MVAWNQKAEVAGKYLDKGSMAVVDGRLQIRTWTDKEGNKRRNAEILADQIYFCGSRQSDGAATTSGAEVSPASDVPDGFTMLDENADDLPF